MKKEMKTITEIMSETAAVKNALAAYEEAVENLEKHHAILKESNEAMWVLKEPVEEVVSDADLLKLDIDAIMADREKRAAEIAIKRASNKLLNRRTVLLERACEDANHAIWGCIVPIVEKRQNELREDVRFLAKQIEMIEQDWRSEVGRVMSSFKIKYLSPEEKSIFINSSLLENTQQVIILPGPSVK